METFLTKDEVKLLKYLAKKSKGAIVEIGSFEGGSTVILSKSKNKVYAIDPHIHGTLENFKKNTSKIKNIIPIIEKSHEAVKKWNKPIHLLWIDGDHSYKSAKHDFLKWEKHLVIGGIVAMHNTLDTDKFLLSWNLKAGSYYGPRQIAKIYIVNSPRYANTNSVDTITYATKIKNRKMFSK